MISWIERFMVCKIPESIHSGIFRSQPLRAGRRAALFLLAVPMRVGRMHLSQQLCAALRHNLKRISASEVDRFGISGGIVRLISSSFVKKWDNSEYAGCRTGQRGTPLWGVSLPHVPSH